MVGYGAPGKGNTLLNHCGIRADLLSYTVDRSPLKQGTVPPRDAYPDLCARAYRRDPPGLRSRPALEPQGRDQQAARATSDHGAGGWSFPIPVLETV